LEVELELTGDFPRLSLPWRNKASANALERAARPRARKKLSGPLRDVRAARLSERVGALKRPLVVVESKELLQGQKRGMAAALRKAKGELHKRQRQAATRRLERRELERGVPKALAREHLAELVVADIRGTDEAPTLKWHVDATRRRKVERSRLGKRVLCTDRHTWRTERIVQAFRGQSNVAELFRRSKKGGIAAWGPSFEWTDTSLRLHTFAALLGRMLVSLAKVALGTTQSARVMMRSLAAIDATLVRTATGAMGRRPPWMLAPELTTEQVRAARIFELERWFPSLLSSRL
jgi:hypothetical protein